MSGPLFGLPFVDILIAIFPALYHWVAGRRLLRDLNDPLLSERLLALGRRSGAVAGLAAGALIFLSARLLWLLPVLVLARVAASYPLRRALYDETWSLTTYLLFTVRAILALAGFWLALLITPIAARTAGSFDWLVGAVMGAGLLFWSARYPRIVLSTFSAHDVGDESLVARFVELAAKCKLPPVRFALVNLQGGAILNAIALPSRTHPSVLFTDTMLARLGADEVVAICAHELAHLEHYHPLLPRMRIATWILVLAAGSMAPLVRVLDLPYYPVLVGWMMLLVASLVSQSRHRQKNETESDRRAVELTGDAEALARALTKAYAFNRYPRRLDLQFEQHATHPSLARRLRDIRAAAPDVVRQAVTVEPLLVQCADGTKLTLESTRLAWSEPDGTSHAIPYEQLSELRVGTGYLHRTRLVAVQKSSRRWEFAIPPEDVAPVQSALDAIDGLLAEPAAPDQWSGISQVAAFVTACLALMMGHVAAGFLAVLAGLRPARAFLAAAGVATLTSVALLIRDGGTDGELLATVAIALAGFGAGLLILSRKTTILGNRRQDALGFTALGTCAAGATVALLVNGTDPVELHTSAAASAGSIVLIAGFAAATILAPRRVARLAGTAACLAALAGALFGTFWFVDTFGRDPLLVAGPPLEEELITGRPIAQFPVPFYALDLKLSPGGRLIALRSYEDVDRDSDESGTAFHVGAPGGELTRIAADDLVFYDDTRVVVLRSKAGRVELEELTTDSEPRVSWRMEMRDVYATGLMLARNGEWTVFGSDQTPRIVRFQGQVGTSAIRETRWSASGRSDYPNAIAGSGANVVVVESDYDPGMFDDHFSVSVALLRAFLPGTPGVRWWRTGFESEDARRSRLSTTCSDAGNVDELVCGGFDGRRTRIVVIESSTGNVLPIGWVRGHFTTYGSGSDGWIAGYLESSPVALNLPRRKVVRFGLAHDHRRPLSITASDSVVGGAWAQSEGSLIRLFSYSTASARR